MLAIEVAFLTGRYVATAFNRRSEAEWPPHPARVFSALVATHFSSLPADDVAAHAERAALEWLEQQGAPHLCASEASRRDVVTVFVPVNDVALTGLDKESASVDVARAEQAQMSSSATPADLRRAATKLAKAETSLVKAIAAQTGQPQGPVRGVARGPAVLPDNRVRQPRTFPSVTPEEPLVTFIWPRAEADAVVRQALQGLLRRVVRIGHSSSLVRVRVTDDPVEANWLPDDEGELNLRVIEAGQLSALERAYAQHRESEPRVMPSLQRHYGRVGREPIATPVSSVFSDEWLVLRRVDGPHLPMTAAAGIARAVRRALLSFAEEPIPESMSGHAPDGAPTAKVHLAVVPLPFVGHANATGLLMGVALVLPLDASKADRKALATAVSRWEDSCRQEDEDAPALPLHLGAAGTWHLERTLGVSSQTTLKPETWCRAARVWSSVTPMALDRNPGDLRARDQKTLAVALAEAEATVRQSCRNAGLPEPVVVELLPAARWAGAAKARHVEPYPGVAGRTQRLLTHVRLLFSEPVTGPVLLGAARFLGLGLFRPEAGA